MSTDNKTKKKETEKLSLIKSFSRRAMKDKVINEEMDGSEQNLDLVMMKFVPITLDVHYYCNLHFMLAQLNFE